MKGILAKVEESNLVVKDATGKEVSAAYKDINGLDKQGLSKGKKIAIGVGVGIVAIIGITFFFGNQGCCG